MSAATLSLDDIQREKRIDWICKNIESAYLADTKLARSLDILMRKEIAERSSGFIQYVSEFGRVYIDRIIAEGAQNGSYSQH